MLGDADVSRIESVISAHGLPTKLRSTLSIESLIVGDGARQEG
jgi:hypothetical protein